MRPKKKNGPALFTAFRWAEILAVTTAVTGTGLSLHIRSNIAQSEATKARLTAETLQQNTGRELELFSDVLSSVGALHAISAEVNQSAMSEFTEKGLVHQKAVLGPFGLGQRITPQIRFELEQQKISGYRVVQQAQNGTLIPANNRPIHYPLTWQVHEIQPNIPVGFDFSSRPELLQAIIRMEQTRRVALAQAAPPRAEAEASYWVFAPVFSRHLRSFPNQTQKAVIGFSVAKLHPQTILNRVGRHSPHAPQLRLIPAQEAPSREPQTIYRKEKTWQYRHRLSSLGTEWIFECALPLSTTGRNSTFALAAGLILTALMTSQLLIIGGRTKKIETKVHTRTRDLHAAKKDLEEMLRERAALEEEITEIASRERRSIGRDLHDSLGQKLTGAAFLSRAMMSPESSDHEHAKTLNETLKSAVSQVRNMARGLAAVTLNNENLAETLEQLAEEMGNLYEISCDATDCSDLPELGRKEKEQLYLIAREAVNNAARHAQAEKITIQLNRDKADWTLRIRDDGKGMSERHSAGKGMGIRIMKHRAERIGTHLTICSTPEKGTCVEIKSNKPDAT